MDKSPDRFGSVSILEYMGRPFRLSTFARAGISSGPDAIVRIMLTACHWALYLLLTFVEHARSENFGARLDEKGGDIYETAMDLSRHVSDSNRRDYRMDLRGGECQSSRASHCRPINVVGTR